MTEPFHLGGITTETCGFLAKEMGTKMLWNQH